MELKYENNFKLVIKNYKDRLLPKNFNIHSELKVKSYCLYFKKKWFEILKMYGEYSNLLEYLKELYIEFRKTYNKKSLKDFTDQCKNVGYDFLYTLPREDRLLIFDNSLRGVDYKDLEFNFLSITDSLCRIPTYNEFNKMTRISITTYASKLKLKGEIYDEIVKYYIKDVDLLENYIFSKKNKKIEIGLKYGRMSSKYEIVDYDNNFKSIFDSFKEEHGSYPTRRIFDKLSKKMDSSSYRRKFKRSWLKICEMYGYEIENKNITELFVLNSISKITNCSYIPQKTWDWLIGVNGRNLYCDGYFEKLNLVVEFDGRQHRIPLECFGGYKSFTTLQKNDKCKDELLKQNGINILRIRSDENWISDVYLTNKIKKIIDF